MNASRRPRPLVVLFDGGCPMCRRTVRLLRRLDWLRRLAFADATDALQREHIAPGLTEADVMAAMYVIDEAENRYAGYDAVLQVARVLPVLWPLRLVGRLPLVHPLGQATYRAIAARRTRRGRCTDEVCAPERPQRHA